MNVMAYAEAYEQLSDKFFVFVHTILNSSHRKDSNFTLNEKQNVEEIIKSRTM